MFLVELSDKKLFTAAADLTCSSEESGCSAAPYQEPVNVRRHQHLLTLRERERERDFQDLSHYRVDPTFRI